MLRRDMPDLVVLIPGILGSELTRGGKAIWSVSKGGALRALFSLGRSIKRLELEGDDPALDDLGDGVVASRLLPDLHLVPGLWTIDGYSAIRRRLLESFILEEGKNYFEFPYDWRRDNRVAGRRLAQASHDWLKAWREDSGNDDAKLVLLCHSMGGIVAREFLERHEGWRDTRTLISFGTPYRGSVNALKTLSHGFEKKLGPINLIDLTAMVRSFTSMYQLLPIYPCYDAGDGEQARVGEVAGVPGVDAAKAAAALAYHHEIRDLARAHGDDPAYVEQGYALHPIVGIDQPTLQSARLEGGEVTFSQQYPGEELGGDGTVPEVSAFPPDWPARKAGTYSSEKHASLQNSRPMLTQVTGLLTAPRRRLDRFQAPAAFSPRLGLDVDEVLEAGRTALVTGAAGFGSPALWVTVTNADTGVEVATLTEGRESDGGTVFETPPLPAGVYRVMLGSDAGPETVTAVVTAIGEDTREEEAP